MAKHKLRTVHQRALNLAEVITELSTEVVEVSPELAARWLEKNHPENRSINWRRVEGFASDMREGKWVLTHQGICFDGDGFLIDGQHRLRALVAAKVAQPMLVARNSGQSYHAPIDRGQPRSIAQIVGLENRTIGALTLLRGFELGSFVYSQMTLAEAEAIYARHEAHFKAIGRLQGRGRMSSGLRAAYVWALPCDETKVLDFAMRSATGEMIARGDPMFALRSWQERNTREPAWTTAMAALNCLRYFLVGLPISSVFTGESGFRAITTRRRVLNVPGTPAQELVPTVVMVPARAE